MRRFAVSAVILARVALGSASAVLVGSLHQREVRDECADSLCVVRRSPREVNDQEQHKKPQQNVNSCHRYVESDERDEPCDQTKKRDCKPHTNLQSAPILALLSESDVRSGTRFALGSGPGNAI